MRVVLWAAFVFLGIGVFGASFYVTEKIIQHGTVKRLDGVTCVNGKVGYIKTSANNKKEIVFPRDQNNQLLICRLT